MLTSAKKLLSNGCKFSRNQATILSSFMSTNTSFNDIPKKKGFMPAIIDLLAAGGAAKLHEHCDRRHKELGLIYREHLGLIEMVFLADTKSIQTVIANEGQFPHHNVPEAWKYYNSVHNVERGIFFQIGEPWVKLRKAFNKVLLANPKKITRFCNQILQINSDLLDTWSRRRQQDHSDRIVIDRVKEDLCKWSIEATGLMLFGNRMGCFESKSNKLDEDPRAGELVRNVARMFQETSNFQVLPVQWAHKLNLKTWLRFESATSTMLRIANEYANEHIKKVKFSQAMNVQGSLMEDLLNNNELSDGEISRSLVDLIIAAADTTSNSLQWMLYLMAKCRDVQEKLFQDSKKLLSSQTLDSDLENLSEKAPYLRAFMKEVARLYPTAPFLARTLPKDIQLGNYVIPKGVPIVLSLYTTSRMEEYFDNPLEFRPERWFRKADANRQQCPLHRNHPYASLPFGIGARKCIGRRAAELEICLFIASFVTTFESSLVTQKDSNLGIKLQMILCPERPIRLQLKLRQ